ncbi:MAG: metal-sulfur cluster assembly factor [Chloroflexota bacterium]
MENEKETAESTDNSTQADIAQKKEGVFEALRSVIDPEIGMNIIELGLVRDVQINEKNAHVNMIMTTPFCPYAPQLLEQTRRTAQDFLGTPTTIEMGMEMWDPSMMEDGAAADWGLF